MRLIFRVFLLSLLAVGISTTVQAEHFTADCPLSLVGTTSAVSPFTGSPHGAFKNGSLVYLLRGQTLTTFETTALGDLKVAREDTVEDLDSRGDEGGTLYHNGYLFVSGEAGLEVFNLTSVHAGGSAPSLVVRIPGLHYTQLAASGNLLAATYSAYDLPCTPTTCQNWVDIYNITNPASPVRTARILSSNTFQRFNDVAFASGFLYTTGEGGTFGFTVTDPTAPVIFSANGVQGEFLATNGRNLLAIGQEQNIALYTVSTGGTLNYITVFTLPSIMNHANGLRFHREAWVNDTRMVTMIDEKDPLRLGESARTIAFDVFDFTVPFYEGFDDRIYENVSMTATNERLFNPIMVGPYVYVVGEMTGTQKWGACGRMAGAIELDSVRGLSCGGSEIHGWVSGATRIVNVEIFLDGQFLGNATIGNPRSDIVTSNEVLTWTLPVNLDAITRSTRAIRAIATDVSGNRYQFAATDVYFPGPGQNCTNRRRFTKR
ncbi:MAG TPA: hypothetical protein VLV48_08145 [Thermoanaerobaculia bacterium]|nr:hypothetical protein [Thermoanaerobaculia bacterium]